MMVVYQVMIYRNQVIVYQNQMLLQGVSKKGNRPKKLNSQKSGSILPETFWFISKKDLTPQRRWVSFSLVRHNYHKPQMNLV